jgi:RHS repeat-associated protein
MWGPDLSGSTHGAGGVGGLLLVCDIPSYGDKDYYFAGADGNGNISVLVDAGAGTVEGRYEYGPFGEPLRVSGSAIAGNNPFRFSSKYTDTESGYLYYGFRYYNPETGRWLNRDPIEEDGGFNLVSFGPNNPLNGMT